MFSISKVGTKSSATHCTAPTGRNGKHCGKRLRQSDGAVCSNYNCQLYAACR
ncbi:hypothetical protein SK571_40815 [Lentzea sp. BCCO 10_0798]|uniref:Uncharacterized protein n=1 Tax=Lentzea kristufekii TaxID=3095430 RepID=A0ABU4U5M2_9PSEU|nr:hypothetical protein [Lentzea sp. BCCO 10_0798]MDX8055757.1 hypothetical protein [Lentzea sp. BCCO 10_0798]